MATGDDRARTRPSPGRIVTGGNPSTATFPHGGENLGYTKDGVTTVLTMQHELLRHRAYGAAPYGVVSLGMEVMNMKVRLLEWDDEVLELLPWATTDYLEISTSSQIRGQLTGALVMFSPEDLTNSEIVVLFNAVAVLSGERAHKRRERKGLDITFIGLPNGNGKTYFEGRIADYQGA